MSNRRAAQLRGNSADIFILSPGYSSDGQIGGDDCGLSL